MDIRCAEQYDLLCYKTTCSITSLITYLSN
jgi:hypothetical protein